MSMNENFNDEISVLTDISDMLEYDMLRYDKTISVEEEFCEN